MQKLVASLMLTLCAVAISSNESARARTAGHHPEPRVFARANLAGHAFQREDRAVPGAYFDLALADGMSVSYRLAGVGADGARIDAVIVRNGLTLAEPDMVARRDAPAVVRLDSPPLTVEFRLDASDGGF
jgi:hypothetical protein